MTDEPPAVNPEMIKSALRLCIAPMVFVMLSLLSALGVLPWWVFKLLVMY